MNLEDRVVVVAGATGGLGRVVTGVLAAEGARVALLGSDVERLSGLASELNLADKAYSVHALQIQDRAAVDQTAAALVGKFGRVDAVLNFVGGWVGGKKIVELAADDLTDMLNQHVWTTFHLMQTFVPRMLENKWGRVVTVSPPNSLFPKAKRAAYAAAKAAQEALMLGLAKEVQGTGVTSNVLVVVAVDAKHERDNAPTPKNEEWTTPEEISAALLYLLSDEAHVVNGQRLVLYRG